MQHLLCLGKQFLAPFKRHVSHEVLLADNL
jgi:hypothetical protein